MDERVKGEYRKIYSELMMGIILFCAASLLYKFVFLKQGMGACITEFLILVLSPVYLAVRQFMLGLNPNENVPKKQKRASFFAAMAAASAAFIATAISRDGKIGKDVLINILIYIAMFTFVFYVSRKLSRYFADKKAKKYEE